MKNSIVIDRLILDKPTEADLQKVVGILNDPIYEQNTLTIPYPYALNDALYWIGMANEGLANGTQYIFAIRMKSNMALIGSIDIRVDLKNNKGTIGYWLDKNYWSNGFMTEALEGVINFGFEILKLKKIVAFHFNFNRASGKVLEKAGMIREGYLSCHVKRGKSYIDEVVYGIVNPNFTD